MAKHVGPIPATGSFLLSSIKPLTVCAAGRMCCQGVGWQASDLTPKSDDEEAEARAAARAKEEADRKAKAEVSTVCRAQHADFWNPSSLLAR